MFRCTANYTDTARLVFFLSFQIYMHMCLAGRCRIDFSLLSWMVVVVIQVSSGLVLIFSHSPSLSLSEATSYITPSSVTIHGQWSYYSRTLIPVPYPSHMIYIIYSKFLFFILTTNFCAVPVILFDSFPVCFTQPVRSDTKKRIKNFFCDLIFSGQRKRSQRVRSNMWMIHHRLSACCLYVPCVVNLWGSPQSRREKEAPTVDYDTLSALRGRRIGLHSICCYGRFRKWWNVIIKATSSRLIMTRNQYGWLIFTIAESERLSPPPHVFWRII